MVDITPLIRSDRKVIQSYSAEQFKISGQAHTGALLVTPERVEPWDNPPDPQALTLENFSQLIDMASEIDVVLFGTGNSAVFVPPSFKRQLKEKGLTLEFMGTGAACRTYNVLLAEGRRVVAALLPVTADKAET